MTDERLTKLALELKVQAYMEDLRELSNRILQEAIDRCEAYGNHIEELRDKTYNAELAGRQIGALRCAQLIRSLII